MEFTKRSNLGSLLAAVLVGLLSLCINQVFRINPESLQSMLRNLTAQTEGAPIGDPLQWSASQLVVALADRADQLSNIFRGQPEGPVAEATAKTVKRLVAELTDGLAALEQIEAANPSTEQLDRGRTAACRGLFLAAELFPNEHAEVFGVVGDAILRSEAAPDQKRCAQLLLGFHDCRVRSDDGDLLNRLRDYSNRSNDDALEIDLYVLAAKEKLDQNQPETALAILRQGRDLYQQHPLVGKLTQALIDLQIESKLRGGR